MIPAVQAIVLVGTDPQPRIAVDRALGNTSPHSVVSFLRASNLSGNLYTPLWWGSYFTWELEPNILVSMDGRNVTLFAPQDVTANLVFYLEANPDLETPLQGEADYLVVPADAPVRVVLKKRDAKNLFREVWAVGLDPKDVFIDRSAPKAPAPLLEIQRSGDPSTKVDFLIIGDGYTAAESETQRLNAALNSLLAS